MPRISAFHGIRIYMYYRDHRPAHFHVRYGSSEASVSIESGLVLRGLIAQRALALALEWSRLHQDELRENWRRAREKELLREIEPLR